MAEDTGNTTTDTAETKAAETTQTTDTKGAETTAAETEAKGTETKAEETKTEETKAEPVTQKQPVDYARVISEAPMPEGFTLDPEAARAGGELFARHDIPPEAVKDLVALYARQQKAGADGNAKAFADQVGTWKATAEKTTTPEERGAAKNAALKIFGKDEVALLEHFGVTNRAGFIKALAKIGKTAIQDDTLVPGDAAAGSGARDARAHFPNSNMNP